MGPIDNKSTSVQVMAMNDKPLHEPVITQFSDAYMEHWALMC